MVSFLPIFLEVEKTPGNLLKRLTISTQTNFLHPTCTLSHKSSIIQLTKMKVSFVIDNINKNCGVPQVLSLAGLTIQ